MARILTQLSVFAISIAVAGGDIALVDASGVASGDVAQVGAIHLSETHRRHDRPFYNSGLNAIKDISKSLQLGSEGKWVSAVWQSLCIVGVAELFDKTWFVALLYAMSAGKRVAFAGAYTALVLHTFIAAVFGLAFAQMFSMSTLHFVTAAVFFVFTVLYSWECAIADPDADAIEARTEEAREDLGECAGLSGKQAASPTVNKYLLWQCFVAVFIAEWGDRTQIAMIALHSSLPLLPVMLGSCVAFFMLTLSAVVVAAMLEGQKLSERLVLGISAVSFLVFGLSALYDGVKAVRS